MACPNITSPEWKALVSAIGVDNAWKEFLIHGKIPDASIYNVEGTTKNIKPGVQELFDSNPELANQVYKALGFRTPNITVLPNGNLKIVAFRTEKVGPTSKGEYQRGKGLYLSLDRPYPGEDVYTVEIEISPKNLLDRKLGFGKISEDFFIDEKNKRVDKQLDTLAEFKQSLGIKAEIGSIDGALMNELVLFDKDLINQALNSKKEYNPQQKQQALQQYSQYLNSIFPDSKVKDIVYHSRFNKENITNKDRWKNGFYTGTKDQADLMADMAESGSNDIMTTSALLINLQNPKVTTYVDRKVEDYKDSNDGFIIEATEKDALQLIGDRDGYNTKNFKKEYVVFEPEQIHILGSKQDIEGFKEFTKTTTTAPEKVLYSIKTKTTAQLAKGIDKDLIKSQREIKYTSFILTGLLNAVGDLTPGKTLSKTPVQAFSEIKDVYTKLRDSINMSLESFIKSDSDLKDIKASSSFLGEDGIAKHFPVLEWVKTYDELLNAKETFEDIISKWDRYKSFVEASLPSKGLQIVKNKIQPVDLQDKEDNDQDETEDVSIPNSEINSQKFGTDIFQTNPYDTATVRVRAMMQTISTGEFEFGIPIYADPTDVMDDMLYAGVSMNLSNFTDKDSKLEQFRTALSLRQDGRPYISKLLNKIEAAEKKGDWEIINQILTFVSKAFANEEILLYTLNRSGSKVNGLTGSKIIGGNRDTIVEQIKRDWLAKHQISGFYNKAADGKLTPNSEKLEKLNTIRQEGKLLTGDAQKQKFIEYFKVLGVPFTMKDLEIISPNISTLFRKGKDFSIVFQDKNLLDNIYTNFVENLNVPFEGQYGFQNEGREMGLLAQLYFDANPNLYKAGATKTADGKTKYLYIQTNSAEISKREFQNTDGTGVTNTALAQPNSGEDSFWKKVKQNIYRFTLGYFNGSREQEIGKEGKVRKNFTEKEQLFNMIASHQADMNYGTYTTFTLSDKTTSLQTKMTKEFFVDTPKIPLGLGKDFIINNNEIEYTNDLKDRIYNSFVEPEISRILSAMKYSDSINLENFNIASKLFYFIPRLNSDPALEDFRKDLYSGKFTINQLNTKHSKTVADIILNEFTNSAENEVNKFIENGIIEINKNNNYEFPLYRNVYVNKFRQTKATNRNLAVLMSMDMKLNYMNSQIKTIQFLKFDPMHSFKASEGVTILDFNKLSGEDKIKLVKSTWDEFSKRAAALIAPGSQGNWTWKYGDNKTYGVNQTYKTVTLKDVKKSNDFFKDFEPTDAQEFVTMQEHIDYLMSEGRIPLKIWEDIYNKIEKAGKGGYYELTKEELGYTLNPMKPVYAGSSKEGNDEAGLNRYDYVKSSRFPLIPQHEAGSERDKLRIWMEKNDIQSANFKSAKKLGRPSLSVEVFDENNNFIEPVDFEKGLQELSRDGLRNQQEIPHQKTQVSTVTQMNRTLFDGLLESVFNFSGLSNVSGTEMKSIKEALRAKMFDNAADKLKEKIGNLHVSNRGLYKLLEETIKKDTTGSYTANDLKSLALNDQGMFEIPLEVQFKFPKFQGLINSMINKNVMLKVEGTSFVQVSGVGAKFNFKDLSKGIKSDIIWTDKFAKTFKDGEVELKYVSKDKQGNVQPAQVIVSQYLKDEEGNLIDLNDFITEKNGVKILDTSRLSPEMLQLIASRIPNQSHVSMLPVEVVGFLPSYMENTIIVPDGITGQMGSDFDVDKLFAYTSKIIKGEDSEGKVTYGPVQYTINSITDISSLNEDQISQAYRDIHWNVLTHEDTFEKITKSVDMDEVKKKVSIREKQLEKYGIVIDEGANLPLDYQTSITRFMDNKSGKDGVSIFANLISAQADLQDKPLTLGKIDSETKKPIYNPIKIKLNRDGDIIDLLYIGKTGSSKSFLGEKRSISDNLNIMFTESVDNAKNQFLREFNWDNKSMGSMGMLSMLTDEKGQAVPIEFMMDFTSQPAIKDLLGLIDLKQDSFGNYDSDALRNGIVELQEKIEKTIDGKRFLKPGEQAGTYLTNENRSKELDPQTLANMWLIGKAIKGGSYSEYIFGKNIKNKEKQSSYIDPESGIEYYESYETTNVLEKIAKDLKYKSVEDMLLDYYTVQYDSLELFQRLNDLGRELMTMLGSMYTYTKGIGGTIFSTKQKLNQLNKLAGSENFLGIENLAGSVSKSDTGIISIIPKGELGSSINNSLIEAQRIYGYLFPISTGKNLEEVVVRLLDGIGVDLNNASANKYEDTFNNVFKSTMQYLYTHPDLELFEDVRETRNRLINGDNSLATRITNLKTDPNWAKNGFIKNLQVEPKWNSNIQTISFKAPFGTQINGDAVENGFYELATYKGENEEEIRSIAKDLVLYVYSTGDAGFMGSKIPIDYVMSDKEFARGIRRIRGTYNENMFKDDVKQNLIDQIVQNNPEEYSKKFSFFSSDDYENNFKKLLKPLIGNSSSLADVSKFTITRGNFKDEQGIVDALSIPLTESEIAAAKLEGLDPYKITGDKIEIKAKYPPYILISDTFKSNYDDSNDRNVKYLYKRTSKALNERGDATYERINILGTSGIKEYDANPDNSDLKSVIKNNNVDAIVDTEMLSDDITSQSSTNIKQQEIISTTPEKLKKDVKLLLNKALEQLKEANATGKNFILGFHGGKTFEKPDRSKQYTGEFRNPESKRIAESMGARYEGQMLFYTEDLSETDFPHTYEDAINGATGYAIRYGDDTPSIQAYLIPIYNADFVNRGVGEVGVSYDDIENDKIRKIGSVDFTRTTQPSTNVEPSGFTNYSGGAYGADTFWDIIGREFGVTNHKHFREASNASLSQKLRNAKVNATIITPEQLEEGYKELERVTGKTYERNLENNLKARNFFQVKNADAVFAIAQLGTKEGRPITNYLYPTIQGVSGGTNAAVQMAIAANKPIYVWDLGMKSWFKWNGKYFEPTETPTLTKNFAGIGSRDIEDYNVKNKETGKWESRKAYKGSQIEEAAKQAIKEVYEKTFKTTTQLYTNVVRPTREYTPEKITKENIPTNGIFVFGSNNRGVHGLGAAKTAVTEFGAVRGQASGQQGKSFAVRTKMYQNDKLTIYNELTEDNKKEMDKMTIEDLNKLRLAAIANPNNKYYVTEIGTKLAGRSVEQMKDLFKRMNNKFGIPDNIILPQVFEVRDVQSTPIGGNEEKNNPFKNSAIQQIVYHVDKRKNLDENTLIDDGTHVSATGVFFTTEKTYAEKYAKDIDGFIYEAYIDAQSPVAVDKEDIQYFGRSKTKFISEFSEFEKIDSLIHESDDEDADIYGKVGTEIVVFEPSQIKLIKSKDELEEKISEPIVLDYKGTNYILEGSDEEGYQVYTISGGKKSRLLTNKKLASNIELSYQISQHPERVVTLTDIQHSPSYYVTPLGEILALASSNFGNQITSESVHKKVMSKINDQNEIVEEPVEEPIIEPKPEQKKEEIVDTNKKEIKVPAGSNPNNNVIMETADAIYLMNDGQQKAFDSIGKKVSTIISTRKKLEPSDFGENVKFNNNLSSKFNNLIPTAMWNNMIGLAGRGGVGKTTVIKAIIESLQKNKYSSPSVLYIAPSHTACTVLQESLGLDSEKANDDTVNTLASHLRKRPNQFNKFELVSEFDYIKSTKFKPAFGSPDIIIIDESSMIGQGDIKDMVQRLYTDFNNGLISRMPVFIFMGDYRQLGPINEKQNDFVNKGVISSTLFLDESKTDELTQVMRSDNAYLHQIYDSVGEQIIKNMEKTKNNQNPERPSLSKYDALTNKSTSNILVVNNERGVIQDYVDYLATNNNPYGMFWIHYNNSTNPVTKTLNESIRKEYFRKIGLSPVAPSHRLYAIGDYVENISPLELTLKNYPGYNTTDENIIKILKNNKNTYNKSTESYTLSGGTIKPNARFKVLDIVESKDSLRSYLNPIIGRFISDKDDAVDVETTIVYNRQNKIRAVPKVLNLAVSFGKYNNASKKQEGITITNYKTNTVIAKFDLPYGAYLDVVENLKMLDTSQGVVSDFIPSYIGSSHTAQGNSIKNVIVGEANIKKAANNGQTNIDDVLSSLYVALTRSSGTLTIVKSSGSPIENNQDVYMGAITDTNNAVRPVSSLQLIDSNIEETSLGADPFSQLSEEEVEFDFTEFFKDNIKIEVVKEVFGNYENATFDTKTILNKVLKDTTQLNKQILSLISNTGGIGGLKIVLDKRIENPGEYDSNTKTIRINPDLSIDEPNDEQDAKKQLHEVIMHELLHHITTSLLNTNPALLTSEQRKWVVALKTLFKSTQEKILKDDRHSKSLQEAIDAVSDENGFLSASDKSMYYGLTSVDEFVSMLITDEGFREFMNNTTYEGDKSIFDKFIEILSKILKALGIQVNDESVLKEGLTNIIGLIESRAENRNAEDGAPLKSITTESNKTKLIKENFESIIETLNIKTQC